MNAIALDLDCFDIIRYRWDSAYVSLEELERYAAYSPGSLTPGSRLQLMKDLSPRHRSGDTVHLVGDLPTKGAIRVHHPKSRKMLDVSTAHVGIARRELAMHTGRDQSSPSIAQTMRPGGGGKAAWLRDAQAKAVAVKSKSPKHATDAWILHGGRLHPVTAHEAWRIQDKGPQGANAWHATLSRIWDDHAKKLHAQNQMLQQTVAAHKGVSREAFLQNAGSATLIRDKKSPRIAHRGLTYPLLDHEHDKGTPVVGPEEILSRVWGQHWAPGATGKPPASPKPAAPAQPRGGAAPSQQQPAAPPTSPVAPPPQKPAGGAKGPYDFPGAMQGARPGDVLIEQTWSRLQSGKGPVGGVMGLFEKAAWHGHSKGYVKSIDDLKQIAAASKHGHKHVVDVMNALAAKYQGAKPTAPKPQQAPAAQAPKGQKFGEQTARQWTAGSNRGTIEFENLLHRDLFDYAQNERRRRGQRGTTRDPKTRQYSPQMVADLAKRAGVPPEQLMGHAWSVADHTKKQMAGLRDGEHRKTSMLPQSNAIQGGKADAMPDAAAHPQALSQGVKVESEHTNNPSIAKEIAKDHLAEDPTYYDKLDKMEKAPVDFAALYNQAKSFQGMVPQSAPQELKRAVYLVRTNQVKGPEDMPRAMAFMAKQASQPLEQRDPTSSNRRILFEVAPDPNNAELASQWNALPHEVRHQASREVVNEVMPQVLRMHGIDANIHEQLGGYLDTTQPSFAVVGGASVSPDALVAAAKTAGFALSQDSMMVTGDSPFAGSSPMAMISVQLPKEMSPDQVHQAYMAIRNASNGSIQGHTTVGNEMLIAVDHHDPQAMATLVDKALGGQYRVGASVGHVAFINHGDYGYASGHELPGQLAQAGSAAHDLRRRATESVQRWIGQHGQQRLEQRSEPAGVGRTNDAGAGAGDPGGGSPQRITARHYTRFGRAITPILDPAFHGTGISGRESARRTMHGNVYPNRLYFYTADDPSSIRPESGLDPSQYHEFTVDPRAMLVIGKHPYPGWGKDILRHAESLGLDPNDVDDQKTAIEHWAKEKGYWGMYHPEHGVGYTFHPIDTSQRDIQHPLGLRQFAEPVLEEMRQAGTQAGIPQQQLAAAAVPLAQQLKVAWEAGSPAFSTMAVSSESATPRDLNQLEELIQSGSSANVESWLSSLPRALQREFRELQRSGSHVNNKTRLRHLMSAITALGQHKKYAVLTPSQQQAIAAKKAHTLSPAARANAVSRLAAAVDKELEAHHRRIVDDVKNGQTKYRDFYGEDIHDANRALVDHYAKQGVRLSKGDIQLYHLLGGLASPMLDPVLEAKAAFQVFDRYMRTRNPKDISGIGEDFASKFTSKDGAAQRLFLDLATMTEQTKRGKHGLPIRVPKPGKLLVSGLGEPTLARLRHVISHFAKMKRRGQLPEGVSEIDAAMEWLGTPQHPSAVASVIPLDKRKPHEYFRQQTKKSPWAPEEKMYPIFALGEVPKVGSYILNRWQNFGTITKDTWAWRTAERMFGLPVTGEPGKSLTQHDVALRRMIDEAWSQVGRKHGMQPAEVQQALWDAEKKIYGAFVPDRGGGYVSQGLAQGLAAPPLMRPQDNPKFKDIKSLPSQFVDHPNVVYDEKSGKWVKGGKYDLFDMPLQQAQGDLKGTYDPTQRMIELVNGRADLSTVIHEGMGHWFHQVISSHPEYKSLIEQHYGKFDPQNNREGLERFARHVESYMRSGQAPSSALSRIFSAIGQWMVNIYRRFRYGTPPPEIKLMMDRIHSDATDPYVQDLVRRFEEAANAPNRYTARHGFDMFRGFNQPSAAAIDAVRGLAAKAITRRPPQQPYIEFQYPKSVINHGVMKQLAAHVHAAGLVHPDHPAILRHVIEETSPGALEHVDKHLMRMGRPQRSAAG